MSVLLSKARVGQCRWLVCDDVGDKRDLFRGRRVCGAVVSFPTSYCLGHRLVVYERTARASGPPQEFAIQRREPEPEVQLELTEIFS